MGKEKNFGDKINSNGLDKNKQNINKEGRPPSIKRELKELLAKQGKIKVDAKQVVSIEEDGSVIIKLPTEMQLAMKLQQWALSNKGMNSLKAIQMIMEQIDGKPQQEVSLTHVEQPLFRIEEEPEKKKK